jgi:hypothetical protein
MKTTVSEIFAHSEIGERIMLDYIASVNDFGTEDMADDSSTQKVDPSLVAEIVASYVAKNSIGVDQIGSLIATVHHTLSGLGTNAPAPLRKR